MQINARFFILFNFDTKKELEHLILNQIEAFEMNKNFHLAVASPRPH